LEFSQFLFPFKFLNVKCIGFGFTLRFLDGCRLASFDSSFGNGLSLHLVLFNPEWSLWLTANSSLQVPNDTNNEQFCDFKSQKIGIFS